MTTSRLRASPPRRQEGSFLLEALIAVLIVALGVIGLLGLLARSMQNIDESKYRGEAAFLANAYMGRMWTADKATLAAHFGDSGGGAEYDEFKSYVAQRLPNASAPVVTINPGPTATSRLVQITLQWKTPGSADVHQYWFSGTIGANK
jgi:type IV pilus assembly protein PilV